MQERYNRSDRLFILASVCKQNNITPDDPAYMGLLIRVCTSKLNMSTDAAKTYAADLESAYRADGWNSIAPPQPTPETPSNSTQESCSNTPTLNTLKTFTVKTCEPIKRIAPRTEILEPEYSPKTICKIIIQLASNQDFNGVGRITLAEIRDELADKSLQLKDIIELLNKHAPNVTVEQRPGNMLLLYFLGKANVKASRPIIIQPPTPVVHPVLEYKQDTYPKQNGIAEEYEDDTDAVDDEEGIPEVE